MLVVLGTALLGKLEENDDKSITSSMAGDIQLYSSTAKDELQLFGSMGIGSHPTQPVWLDDVLDELRTADRQLA